MLLKLCVHVSATVRTLAGLLALGVGILGFGHDLYAQPRAESGGTAADQRCPVLDPVEAISQETKTEIKFALRTGPAHASPLRFLIAGVRRDGQVAPVPRNMHLDADKGVFAWTPTSNQAGTYELTLVAKDVTGRQGRTNARITVRERSICSAPGAVGDLLRKWHAEGTAAGNTGDFYDNRDRDHSPLHLAPYPQLDVVTYTDQERQQRIDWALQIFLMPHVTFGNSSTSAPVLFGGSNVRTYYTHPRGMEFLYQQYRANNLYMYPGHHDHHPGHNGSPFYGDVYPANCPYLITSQGSSGTDQPFMRAVPLTLAAFRPEVKKRLAETGLLMPTVQMIFRSSNKHLIDPRDYLTGKAHPSVFEGSWVDNLKMVQAAHEVQLHNLPPLIQLQVESEDEPVEGRDYFEPGATEKLADTPAAISRVVRGRNYIRKMIVSAAGSFDLNHKPLTYHWAVLRGDKDRIKIEPKNVAGSVVEIQVPYHDRRKIDGNPNLESNRVDIGAFVHNGTYYSAPGFITFFALDNEARTYDDRGRLLEIGYGVGDAALRVADWNGLFGLCKRGPDTLAGQLLKKPLTAEQLAIILKAAEEYQSASAKREGALEKSRQAAEVRQKAAAVLKAAEDRRATAQKAHEQKPGADTEAALKQATQERDAAATAGKRAEADAVAAQQVVAAASKTAADILEQKREGLELPVKGLCERTLNCLKENPTFYLENREAIEAFARIADSRKARLTAAQQRLVAFGLLREQPGQPFALQSTRPGSGPLAERLTRFEKSLLERFHAEVLSGLVFPPGVLATSFQVNFVDQRLSTLKNWRDVYRYDAEGNPTGWTRYDENGARDFNPEGLAILEKDGLGRTIKAQTVRYEHDPRLDKPVPGHRMLKQTGGDRIIYLEYDGAQDRRGRIRKQETREDKK